MISVDAPAKINLYLHVTGKVPDDPKKGFHQLDSLIVFADYGDRLEVSPSNQRTLTIDGPFADGLSAEGDNLVMRAADGLAAVVGSEVKNTGAAINLSKRLPVASGIGGGSADAAAALKALCRFWKVSPDPAALGELAASLGADVPVCLSGEPSFVGGFGEILTPAPPLPECWLVLVNPLIPLSTPEVFKHRTGEFSPANPFQKAPETAQELAELLSHRGNDLTAAAIEIAPDISEILAALENQPGNLLARLSGSGATCFGLFAEKEAAMAAQKQISAAQTGWWIKAAKINA